MAYCAAFADSNGSVAGSGLAADAALLEWEKRWFPKESPTEADQRQDLDLPVWVTFLDHGGSMATLRYGSLDIAEASLRYTGIRKERILKVEKKREE